MTNPLDKFRRAAKALKAGYESGLPDALTRIATVKPRSDGADLRHADYLHVIAQENSFATWPVMKDAIESVGLGRAQKIQKLKIALHAGRTGVVTQLMEQTPNLAKDHFGLLCALNDVKSVWTMLKDDPTLATQKAGPFLPMVHLCKSRMFSVQSEGGKDSVAIADMLVANGADVNVGSVEQDEPLSPLYWALGHVGNMELAAWLLENGADPNDGESLYHATELGHADGLSLLLKHGADPKQTNALQRAMDFDSVEMVELLLSAGADPNEGSDAWAAKTGNKLGCPALHHAAYRMNSGPVVDLLLKFGADPAETWEGHSAHTFAYVFGNTVLADRIEALGLHAPMNEIETMLGTAATGAVPTGYIDPAKLPKVYRFILREILQLPGKLPHIKALVAIGLEWDLPDNHGVTPVQLAGWNGLADVMGYFLKLSPNLGHVNNYGGTLLSTIMHGAENNPQRANGDYIACLQLALDEGVALPRTALDASGSSEIRAFLTQWAKDRPGQVVEYGIV